jgi:hypothetical protein
MIFLSPSSSSQWTTSGSDIYYTTGDVLIGSASDDGSGAKLQVAGSATITGEVQVGGNEIRLNYDGSNSNIINLRCGEGVGLQIKDNNGNPPPIVIGGAPFIGLTSDSTSLRAYSYYGTSNLAPFIAATLTAVSGATLGGMVTSGPVTVTQPTTGPGTVSVSGTAVTGASTFFTNTFKVGDTITVTTTSGAETKTIASITSDTALVTDAFAGTASGVAYTLVGGTRFVVRGNGNVFVGAATDDGTGDKLQVTGSVNCDGITTSALKLTDGGTAPASASASGVKGTILYDGDYLYVCVADDTWKRAAWSAWA